MIRGKPSFVKMQYLLGGDCLWLGLPVTRDEGFSVFAISDASVSSLADALCSSIECSLNLACVCQMISDWSKNNHALTKLNKLS